MSGPVWVAELGLPRIQVYDPLTLAWQDVSAWTEADGTYELEKGQDGTVTTGKVSVRIPFVSDAYHLEIWQKVRIDDTASTVLAPVGAPVATVSVGGGTTLHAGQHTAVYTYVLEDGSETLPSPPSTYTVSTGDALIFAALGTLPPHVASVRHFLTPYNSSNRYLIHTGTGAGFTYGLEPAVAAQPPSAQPYPRPFFGFIGDLEDTPAGLESVYLLNLQGPDVLFDKSSGQLAADLGFADGQDDATIVTQLAQAYLVQEIAGGEIDLTGINATGYCYRLVIPAGTTFRDALTLVTTALTNPAPSTTPSVTRHFGASTLDPGVWTLAWSWVLASGETLIGPTTQVTINDGHVATVVVDAGGWYETAPTVTFTDGAGTGAAATATVVSGVITAVTVTAGGSGYTTAPLVSVTDGTGSGASLGALLSNGAVVGVQVLAGGSSYSSSPVLGFHPGDGAAATAVLGTGAGGQVAGVTLTNHGHNYTSTPTATFTGGGGSGATGIGVLTPGITSTTITNGGTGYGTAPAVTVSGGNGAGATATAVLSSGHVDHLTLTAGGAGYTQAPLVQLTGGGGSGALFTAQISGGAVVGFTKVSGGAGYTSAPTVAFTALGLGGGATITATVSGGAVTALTITNPGHDYTSTPVITIAPGSGVQATATATLSNVVGSVLMQDGGVGYTGTPTVGFTGGGGGSAAAGTARMAWPINHVTVTAGGQGYSAAPPVAFTGGGGYGGGAAHSTLAAGHGETLMVTPPTPGLPPGVSSIRIYLSDGPNSSNLLRAGTSTGSPVTLTAPGSGPSPPSTPPPIEAPVAFWDWTPDNSAHTAPWQWRLHWLLPSTIPADPVLLTNDQDESSTPGAYVAHIQGGTWRHDGHAYGNRQLAVGTWPNNTPPTPDDPPRPYYVADDTAAQAAIGRILSNKPIVDSSLTTIAACQAKAAAALALTNTPTETLAGVIADVPYVTRMPARVTVQGSVLPGLGAGKTFGIARGQTSLQSGVPQHSYDLGAALLGGHGGGTVTGDRVPPDAPTWHRPAGAPTLTEDTGASTSLINGTYGVAYSYLLDDGTEEPLSATAAATIGYHHGIAVAALPPSTIPPRAVATRWYVSSAVNQTTTLLRYAERTGGNLAAAFTITALGSGAAPPAVDDTLDFPTNVYDLATGTVHVVITPFRLAAQDVSYLFGEYRVDGGLTHAIPGNWPPGDPPAIPLAGLPVSRGTTHRLEVHLKAVDGHGNVSPWSAWRALSLAPPTGPTPPSNLRLDVADFPPAGYIYSASEGCTAVILWDATPDATATEYQGEWWLLSDPTNKNLFNIPLAYSGQTLPHLFHDGNASLHTYQFHMRSLNRYGDPGVWSDDPGYQSPPLTFCPPPEDPPPPTGLGAAVSFDTLGLAFHLTWTPPAGYTPGGYGVIVTDVALGNVYHYDTSVPHDATGTSFHADPPLHFARDTTYNISVYTISVLGDPGSTAATLSAVNTGHETPAPADPTCKAGASGGIGFIEVVWPASDPSWSYLATVVDWRISGQSTWPNTHNAQPGSTRWVIPALTPGKTYQVRRGARTLDGTTVSYSATTFTLPIPQSGPPPVPPGGGGGTADEPLYPFTQIAGHSLAVLDPTTQYSGLAAYKLPAAGADTITVQHVAWDTAPGQVWKIPLAYKRDSGTAISFTGNVEWSADGTTWNVLAASTLTLPSPTTSFAEKEQQVTAPAGARQGRLNLNNIALGAVTLFFVLLAPITPASTAASYGPGTISDPAIATAGITDPTKLQIRGSSSGGLDILDAAGKLRGRIYNDGAAGATTTTIHAIKTLGQDVSLYLDSTFGDFLHLGDSGAAGITLGTGSSGPLGITGGDITITAASGHTLSLVNAGGGGFTAVAGAASMTAIGGNGFVAQAAGDNKIVGAVEFAWRKITANRTLDATDYIVDVDTSGGAVTVTIPLASGLGGRPYLIKKVTSDSNAVTIARTGSDTFEGATSLLLKTQYAAYEIYSNNVDTWEIKP